MRTVILKGFAQGPRDLGRWRLDQLDAQDRNLMWATAAPLLGVRAMPLGRTPADALDGVAAALKEVDMPTMARTWDAEMGAFVLDSPTPRPRPHADRVWRGHDGYTKASQWTADALMPNAVIRDSYANSSVPTLSGRRRKLGSAASPLEGMHLYMLARQHRVRRSLEVGMACGMSTLYILQGILDGHKDAAAEKAALPSAPRAGDASTGAAAGASASASASTGEASPGTGAWRPRDEHRIAPGRFAALEAPPATVVAEAATAAAEGCLHISVDPFQETQWEGAARSQVHRAGLAAISSHVQRPSHIAMPAVEAELGPGSLDLVFVDGMHLYDYTLVDLFCADRLLRVGGIVALDDIQHDGVRACEAYIESNYPHWRRLRGTACDRTAATWIKEGPDVRKWDDHTPIPPGPPAAGGRPAKRMRA